MLSILALRWQPTKQPTNQATKATPPCVFPKGCRYLVCSQPTNIPSKGRRVKKKGSRVKTERVEGEKKRFEGEKKRFRGWKRKVEGGKKRVGWKKGLKGEKKCCPAASRRSLICWLRKLRIALSFAHTNSDEEGKSKTTSVNRLLDERSCMAGEHITIDRSYWGTVVWFKKKTVFWNELWSRLAFSCLIVCFILGSFPSFESRGLCKSVAGKISRKALINFYTTLGSRCT